MISGIESQWDYLGSRGYVGGVVMPGELGGDPDLPGKRSRTGTSAAGERGTRCDEVM